MEITSFSQRINKIYGNRNFEDLVLFLKLKLEVKNWYMHTKQLPTNLGCHCRVRQLSEGAFPPFNSSLNFLKFRLNSCLPPPLRVSHLLIFVIRENNIFIIRDPLFFRS